MPHIITKPSISMNNVHIYLNASSSFPRKGCRWACLAFAYPSELNNGKPKASIDANLNILLSHTENPGKKCPLYAFEVTGRQILKKIHRDPLEKLLQFITPPTVLNLNPNCSSLFSTIKAECSDLQYGFYGVLKTAPWNNWPRQLVHLLQQTHAVYTYTDSNKV